MNESIKEGTSQLPNIITPNSEKKLTSPDDESAKLFGFERQV